MIKLAAFDFDGTIADSVELCLSTFDTVLKKVLGKQSPEREELYRQFGRNEAGILRHYLGALADEAFAEFCRLHEEGHKKICPTPFPGLKEVLLSLKSRGIKIVLLTGRSQETAQISLRCLGLTGLFDDFWYGSSESSSKSAQMREMLERFQLKPEEAVYIGDAASDAQSSFDAGLRCLSAAWAGSARKTELEKINPGFVFDTISSLQEWLNVSCAGSSDGHSSTF